MKNKIQDLRDHLFATIEGLLDDKKPLEIERAKAVADVAQTIINSAKVEVDMLRVLDRPDLLGTGFVPLEEPQPRRLVGSGGGAR